MSGTPIAVAPRLDPVQSGWIEQAVAAGGGVVVEPPAAEGLIWMNSRSSEGLAEVLDKGPNIRWVQLPLAGIERFVATGLLSDGRTWTCAKGLYSQPVAEHALALGLAGMRSIGRSLRAQTWERPTGRLLHGRDVCIVGGGGITEALLCLLEPFATDNTVVRAHPTSMEGAHRVLGTEGLDQALAQADLVVLALALTPETEGLIGQAELAAMRPTAWLVNVARGAHVRTGELVAALEEGSIGGAALDVTDPEPLPDGHPLWSLPNAIITPHVANTPAMALGPLSERIRENVARFTRGDALVGLVDPALGY
jgi:phosphoglycerate dehydrogenase-like enzyme